MTLQSCHQEWPMECHQEWPMECHQEWPAMRNDYIEYLGMVRNLSPHTLECYGKDLEKYEAFLAERGVSAEEASVADARGFVAWLSREGLAPRSVNRMVSGVRGWYRY